ncbi:glycosyltransferase family 2 protein [Flammeovirga kamogawensis]|uniref:Glycosyltransferase n=1 Tax=Flammeovirga kamogawensis TaxID=373891 RepID=A0ABX8GWX8_9BACT|nr:glycosyltransferase [Flammeovirga kamogawensis]MBB6460747.1 glycosyltransferase involved in cell wall biosynthesis [Flammeovirga kamogawensis]QWG08100.1 glycosyltransferase [Flammeovirga kamogawensis]TRX69903.1 glycosyltransferase [Flammeovirga kamogawensis]
MNNILFSIIIPTYNRANFIKKTIQSVTNQTYTNFEIVVVDDGSTDNTEEIIHTIQDHRLQYYKKRNAERGAARNYGAKIAKGEYIYFLDSDDLLYTNHLEVAYHFIIKNNPNIFFQQYEFTKEDGSKIPNLRVNESINKLLLTKGNFMSCHGVFLSSDIFSDNQFVEDRKLAGSEDYELWLRIAARQEILYSNTVTSTLVFHDDRSVLNFSKEKLIERKLLFLKYIKSDKKFRSVYGQYIKAIEAGAYSYIALHIALTKKDKFTSLKYLWKSIKVRPYQVLEKRTLGILKQLIF